MASQIIRICGVVLALVLAICGPVAAAVGSHAYGFNSHGREQPFISDDYYLQSEYSGRDMGRNTWQAREGRVLNRPSANVFPDVLILESFSERNRAVEPYIPEFIVFDGQPVSGPILRLNTPVKGWKIRGGPSVSSDISVVPLPPTFPLLAIGMLGIAALGQRRKRTRRMPSAKQ
jgi:hypothetical protein